MTASPARIGLGAQLLNVSGTFRSAGISNFISHLLHDLDAPDLELHAFTNEPASRALSKRIHWHITRLPTHSPFARIFWEQAIQPVHTWTRRLDLFHALAYVQPVLSPVPTIVTVYDLSFLFYPQLFRALNRLYLKFGTRSSVQRARRVLAISESTKRDLCRVFGIPANQVVVIPCGVEEKFFDPGPTHLLRSALPEKFVLYLGTLEPRKNIPRLVRAFARVKKSAHVPHKLVLAGGRGWFYDEIARALETSEVRDEIVVLGFVAADDLPALYRAADAFVYPSLYEGFGLPPLEAMASGTPVIASNVSALPEVVGDAGLLVDPYDENALVAALVAMLTNSALREELRGRGIRQARNFSWSAGARATAQLYREVLAV